MGEIYNDLKSGAKSAAGWAKNKVSGFRMPSMPSLATPVQNAVNSSSLMAGPAASNAVTTGAVPASQLRQFMNGSNAPAKAFHMIPQGNGVTASIPLGVGHVSKGLAFARNAGLAGLATAGIEGARKGFNTSTDEYAERMGLDKNAERGFMKDLGIRTVGVLGDVGRSIIDPISNLVTGESSDLTKMANVQEAARAKPSTSTDVTPQGTVDQAAVIEAVRKNALAEAAQQQQQQPQQMMDPLTASRMNIAEKGRGLYAAMFQPNDAVKGAIAQSQGAAPGFGAMAAMQAVNPERAQLAMAKGNHKNLFDQVKFDVDTGLKLGELGIKDKMRQLEAWKYGQEMDDKRMEAFNKDVDGMFMQQIKDAQGNITSQPDKGKSAKFMEDVRSNLGEERFKALTSLPAAQRQAMLSNLRNLQEDAIKRDATGRGRVWGGVDSQGKLAQDFRTREKNFAQDVFSPTGTGGFNYLWQSIPFFTDTRVSEPVYADGTTGQAIPYQEAIRTNPGSTFGTIGLKNLHNYPVK